MTRTEIEDAQKFLTLLRDDRVYRICNVEQLLERHKPEAVLEVLQEFRKDCLRDLRTLILRDKTHPRINMLVAMNFRLRMAINTIKNAIAAEAENEAAWSKD